MPFYSFTNGMLVRVACKNVLWSYMWLILSISLQYKLTVIVSAFFNYKLPVPVSFEHSLNVSLNTRLLSC